MFQFINDGREEVRRVVLESIAGLSLDESFRAALTEAPEQLSLLFSHTRDPSFPCQHDTWRALVNLAQDPRIAGMFSAEEVCYAARYILNSAAKLKTPSSLIFPDLACMFLANVSKNVTAAEYISEEFTLPFLELMCGCLDERFNFLFSVLADLTLVPQSRVLLTKPDASAAAGASGIPFLKLIPFLQDENIVKRGGTAVVVKNCLLEVSCHEAVLADYDDVLLAGLLGRLVSPDCVFSPEEQDKMLVEVALEHCETPSEPDSAIREMIVESLVGLGTTRRGRELMREKEVYAVMREAHKLEQEQSIKNAMEVVVEYLIRDEE